MKTQKRYTREEKIKYYQFKVLRLEFALKNAQERLEHVMSDNYQDWNETVSSQIEQRRKRRKSG